MEKTIAILGSTGSIGTQTLEVVRENQDIRVAGLSAGSNITLLEKQNREFHRMHTGFIVGTFEAKKENYCPKHMYLLYFPKRSDWEKAKTALYRPIMQKQQSI